MRAGTLLLTLASAACGRISFDDRPVVADADSTPTPDACPVGGCAFDPGSSNCRVADTGPGVLAGSLPTPGSGFGVWVRPPYVFAADTTAGLRSARFDGAAFTPVDSLPELAWAEAVWADSNYFYVGSPGTGLSVVEAAADGTLAILAQNTTESAEARRGWTSGNSIFVPSGLGGLRAYTFDGANLNQQGAALASMSFSQGVFAQGSRVMFADAGVFRIVDFDGATFTDLIPPDTRHMSNTRVWATAAGIFVANGDGLTAYRLSGTTLVELDHYPTGIGAREVWSDGVHVFVAAESEGVHVLAFDNDQFTLIDTLDSGGTSLGVIGDGTYIYTNDVTGVRAFTGFGCLSL